MPGFKSDTPNTNKQKSYQNGPKLLEAAVGLTKQVISKMQNHYI